MSKSNDPLDINGRLYKQVANLLDDMEAADREDKMTMPQRIAALIAVGRVQKMFQDLRKGEFNAGAGSAIDKYSTAFASPDAVSRRGQNTRPTYVNLDSDDAEPGDPDYDAAN